MMDLFAEYFQQAPMAALLLLYIWLSDKQKMKLIKGAQDHNKELMDLIKDLTRKK